MSYTSKVEIANIAFALLGADPIRTFDENNKRSRSAGVLYEMCRDYALTQLDWGFARKFALVNELDEADYTAPDGLVAYQIPRDCLNVLEVYPRTRHQKYEIVADRLYTDIDTPSIKYTTRVTDPTKYPVYFAQAVGVLLAARMSPSITQDKDITKSMLDQFSILIAEAMMLDANQGASYREYDENPDNDTFVRPDSSALDDVTDQTRA